MIAGMAVSSRMRVRRLILLMGLPRHHWSPDYACPGRPAASRPLVPSAPSGTMAPMIQTDAVMDFPGIESTVGNTPLVRLKRLPGETSNVILVKLEGNNP